MISVCLATYNGEKYIVEQLESILSQLSSKDEIIISDDNSSDSTIDLIKRINDNRIRIYHNAKYTCKYKGVFRKCFSVARNFENALKYAKGESIFLADQDDVWLKGRVDAFLTALKTSDLVLSDCIITDAALNQIVPSNFALNKPSKSILNNILHQNYLGCCMAFNRQLLEKVLPLPKEPIMHDIWIALLGCYYGKVTFIDKPYLLYRRHGNNASKNIDGPKNPLSFRISYRFILFFTFIKYVIKNSVNCKFV